MSPTLFIYGGVILSLYIAIAIGRIPTLRMNRTSIAVVGAALLLAIGAIDQPRAFQAIDLATITILFAMMIINVNLRAAGFFGWIGYQVLRIARTPQLLLGLVILASGVLSALFLNDPICLLFTPFVIDLTQRMKRDPIPYLIGLATAANIGSTATITGNPQNLIIGQASGISYLTFLIRLAPIAVIGLGIAWGVIIALYPKEFRGSLPPFEETPPTPYRPLLNRTLGIVLVLLVAYLAGLPIASSALIAAGMLLVSRLRPARLFALEWDLLAFFAGLFIITGAIETTGISHVLFEAVAPILRGGVATLSVVTAILSNLVSNVPAVLLFKPIIPNLPNPEQAWLTLAMASTLAGNLSLLGSVANLIVAEVADQQGVKLTFMAYLRVGIPVTLLTILVGVLVLSAT